MSQSTDKNTLRSLRQEYRELITALKVKKGIEASIIALPSTNNANNIIWLKKSIQGLKAQLDTKRTRKTAPKSGHKGKWSKKAAEQFITSFDENYDDGNIKDIEDLRKRSKNKKVLKQIKTYDEEKQLCDWLKKEFEI